MGVNTEKIESRDKLADEIKKLESKDFGVGEVKLPSVKLDELEYAAPSDAELERSAVKSLSGYRNDGIKTINERSAEDEKALADKRETYIKNRDGDIAELDDRYKKASEAADGDIIKRGLARSSIAAAIKSELEKSYLESNAALISDYAKSISSVDGEIAVIGAKLKKALDDFNIAYAAKLNEKLEQLKADRNKTVAEVTAYNNKVRLDRAKAEEDRIKAESDLNDAAIERERKKKDIDGMSGKERDEVYKSVYDKMDEFLSSMSPEQAKLEIRNHSIYREHLSNYYYNRLYDKYGR